MHPLSNRGRAEEVVGLNGSARDNKGASELKTEDIQLAGGKTATYVATTSKMGGPDEQRKM